MLRLKDKVAIVTGGGRGIGRDISLAYAREGAHVVVSDIDPNTAKTTSDDIKKLGQKSIDCQTDVSKAADINAMIEKTIKEYGRVDILVNNAMRIVPGKLEELPEAAWDTTMNIGWNGLLMAFVLMQLLPDILERRELKVCMEIL